MLKSVPSATDKRFHVAAEARMKMIRQSYTNKAVLVFLLYWLFYIPGLVANIIYFHEAYVDAKNHKGIEPQGFWPLAIMLIVLGCSPIWFALFVTLLEIFVITVK